MLQWNQTIPLKANGRVPRLVKETLHQNGYPEYFLFPQRSPSRKDREEKGDHRSHAIIPYIQGISKAVTKILSDVNVQVPFMTLRRILSHTKDHIPDGDHSSVVHKITVMPAMLVKWGGHSRPVQCSLKIFWTWAKLIHA